MLQNTQGLVLHTTKYGETSIIAKVFTRELGLCSYIIKGVRNSSGRTKQNLLQPMSHLQMTVYNNPKKQLQYIKEIHQASHLNSIATDGVKMSLLFFMDEVIYKSLKEAEPNVPLFDYIVDQLQMIDVTNTDNQSFKQFPIHFLIAAARHLGIEPMDNYSAKEPMFNLKEGRFLAVPTAYNTDFQDNIDYYLDPAASSHFHICLSCTTHNSTEFHLNAAQRTSTLNNLLEYYHIHLSDFRNFTSHQILHEVLK